MHENRLLDSVANSSEQASVSEIRVRGRAE